MQYTTGSITKIKKRHHNKSIDSLLLERYAMRLSRGMGVNEKKEESNDECDLMIHNDDYDTEYEQKRTGETSEFLEINDMYFAVPCVSEDEIEETMEWDDDDNDDDDNDDNDDDNDDRNNDNGDENDSYTSDETIDTNTEIILLDETSPIPSMNREASGDIGSFLRPNYYETDSMNVMSVGEEEWDDDNGNDDNEEEEEEEEIVNDDTVSADDYYDRMNDEILGRTYASASLSEMDQNADQQEQITKEISVEIMKRMEVDNDKIPLASSALQQMITDPVTYDIMRTPYILPCGHMFEGSTIARLDTIETSTGQQRKCPVCNQHFHYDPKDVRCVRELKSFLESMEVSCPSNAINTDPLNLYSNDKKNESEPVSMYSERTGIINVTYARREIEKKREALTRQRYKLIRDYVNSKIVESLDNTETQAIIPKRPQEFNHDHDHIAMERLMNDFSREGYKVVSHHQGIYKIMW